MDRVSWSGTADVIENLINGNISDAVDLIRYRCKTRPSEQAFRLGVVVGALVDPDGYYNSPNLAVTLLRAFICHE